MVVVLPAPLCPSNPHTVPAGTEKLTPDRADVLPPKVFVRPTTSIASELTVGSISWSCQRVGHIGSSNSTRGWTRRGTARSGGGNGWGTTYDDTLGISAVGVSSSWSSKDRTTGRG